MLLKVSDFPFDSVCVCLREKDRESERVWNRWVLFLPWHFNFKFVLLSVCCLFVCLLNLCLLFVCCLNRPFYIFSSVFINTSCH